MADKRYQFFISSTYDDLKEERQEILNVILRLNHIPAGMEFFSSVDQEQLDFIRGIIDESDYYVLILAARYGSVDDDGISYTEREYDYAVSKGKKVIALIHANPDKIEREKTDKDENLFKKLIKFRDKVKNRRLISYWENTTELVSKFQSSLIQTIKRYPEIGWMRGDSVKSPEMKKKIDELEQENKLYIEKIKKKSTDIKALELEKNQLNEQIASKENNMLQSIEALKQEKQNLESTNKDLLEKFKVLEQANKKLKEQNATIEHDMFQKIEELKQKNKQLAEQIKRDGASQKSTESIESPEMSIEAKGYPKIVTETFQSKSVDHSSDNLLHEYIVKTYENESEKYLENRIIIEACSVSNPNIFAKREIKCIAINLKTIYNHVNSQIMHYEKEIGKFCDMLKTCCILLRFTNPTSYDIIINAVEHHFYDSEGVEITMPTQKVIIDNKENNIVLNNFNMISFSLNQFPINLSPYAPKVYTGTRMFKVSDEVNLTYLPVIYVNNLPIVKKMIVKCEIIPHILFVQEVIDIIQRLKFQGKFNETGVFEYVNSVIMNNGWM